ncbi:MAB_1171c family putative transporter [Streptomyces sp. NPDC102467]|uniref:MAB_1171c family putative transporter n=1 Tax=Streptomyces sp. NPDC102467 TaxID=3366179 RepID=UPI003808F90F
MITVLFPVAAAIAGLSLAYKLGHLLRGPRTPALATLCLLFASSIVVFALTAPAVAARVDDIIGVPGCAFIGRTVGSIILLISEQFLLTAWVSTTTRMRVAARIAIAAESVAVLTLLVLFFLDRHYTQGSTNALYGTPTDGYKSAYMMVYIVACIGGELQIGTLGSTYARRVGRLWLRRGLRLVSRGAYLTLVFATVRVAMVLGVPLGPLGAIGLWLGSAGVMVKLIGWTIPSWAPSVEAAASLVRSHRDHLRLRPLWISLYRANPDIALDAPRTLFHEALSLHDADYSVHRRVIEIRDGLVALTPYLDEPTEVDDPVLAADRIAAGLRNRLSHSYARSEQNGYHSCGAERDLAGERVWLTEVSRAFTRQHVRLKDS